MTLEWFFRSCSCTLERSSSRNVRLVRAKKHLLSKAWMLEAVGGQCAVRCEALRPHRGSGVLQSISNRVRRKVWCSAQALLQLCLWLASYKFSSSSLRRYGVGEGVFTTDVNTCTVEPEGMIGDYCNSWYKCCTLTVKLKNLCNLNEV